MILRGESPTEPAQGVCPGELPWGPVEGSCPGGLSRGSVQGVCLGVCPGELPTHGTWMLLQASPGRVPKEAKGTTHWTTGFAPTPDKASLGVLDGNTRHWGLPWVSSGLAILQKDSHCSGQSYAYNASFTAAKGCTQDRPSRETLGQLWDWEAFIIPRDKLPSRRHAWLCPQSHQPRKPASLPPRVFTGVSIGSRD